MPIPQAFLAGSPRVLPIRRTSVTSVTLHQRKRASTVTAMDFIDHAQNAMRKQERIETLEAILATREAMGAEPDSQDVKELKERIKTARMQFMVMKGAPVPPRAAAAPHAIGV